MKVALYARVSTKQHGQDVETQLHALREEAKRREWTVAGIYADRGWSGTKASRPELDRLMRDAHRGVFDAVAVARFDRFGRSLKHLISALESFSKWNVHFISLNESIDTTSTLGRLVFAIIGAIAEFERAIIAERVVMGLARARAQGTRLGRPRQARVDEEEISRQVRRGQAIAQIARQCGLARSTVRAISKRSAPAIRRRAAQR